MDTGHTDVLSRHPFPRHRLTLDEYHRLGEAGILGEDDRVELLEGQLVDMSPIGPWHALAVDTLIELLVIGIAGHAGVRVLHPIELGDATEPQPDIVLVRRPWRGYPTAHPRLGDIFLVIARADCRSPGLWTLTTDACWSAQTPGGDRYGSTTRVEPSGVLEVEALAGVTNPAAALFV